MDNQTDSEELQSIAGKRTLVIRRDKKKKSTEEVYLEKIARLEKENERLGEALSSQSRDTQAADHLYIYAAGRRNYGFAIDDIRCELDRLLYTREYEIRMSARVACTQGTRTEYKAVERSTRVPYEMLSEPGESGGRGMDAVSGIASQDMAHTISDELTQMLFMVVRSTLTR